MRVWARRLGAAAVMLPLMMGAPAAYAVQDGPGHVSFKPMVTTVRPAIYAKQVLRHHTLVVVPLYVKAPPNAEVMRGMGAAAKSFWEGEIPGLTLTVRYAAPKRLASACNRTVTAAWATARRVARINPYATGNHVLAYAPECGMSGIGSLRAGSGLIYIGMEDHDGAVLAHEFGHNLGLGHANDLSCRAGGAPVSLSRSCTETEYGNWTAVMGNGPLVAGVRAGPIAQAALTGRVVTVPARGERRITLSAVRSGRQTAVLRTRYGTVYLSAAQDRRRDPREPSGDAHLQAEVFTDAGSGLIHFPEVATAASGDGYQLERGDAWDVPGTSQRILVERTDGSSVTFRVLPARQAATAAPTLVAPADGTFPIATAWTLAWTAPEGRYAAFLVRAAGATVARVDGRARSVVIPAEVGTDDPEADAETTTFSVLAVGADGGVAESAPVTLTAVRPTMTVVSSVGESPPAVVTAPFALSWSVSPAVYAGAITSWEVTYAGVTTSLPANQASTVIDPAPVAADGSADVTVVGLDSRGHAVASSYYWFTTVADGY